MSIIDAIPPFAVLERDVDEYYTDWRCARCDQWRDRTYPGTVITRSTGSEIQCREHTTEEECYCHCHESGLCDECGNER